MGGRDRGRVASEGQDVLDPSVAVSRDDLHQFRAGVTGAREMRHRRHAGLAQDLHHEVVGAFTRGAAGPVGDRHVRRRQRLELDERALEDALHLLGARRTELERVARSLSQDLVDLRHSAGQRTRHSPQWSVRNCVITHIGGAYGATATSSVSDPASSRARPTTTPRASGRTRRSARAEASASCG